LTDGHNINAIIEE